MDYSTDILDRSIDVVEVQKKLMSELLDALNTYKSDTVKLESDAFSEFNKKAGELEFCQKGFSSCQEIAQEGNDLIPLTNYLKTKLTTCFIPLKDMLKPLKTRVALAEEQFKKLAKYVKLCKNAKVKVLVLIAGSNNAAKVKSVFDFTEKAALELQNAGTFMLKPSVFEFWGSIEAAIKTTRSNLFNLLDTTIRWRTAIDRLYDGLGLKILRNPQCVQMIASAVTIPKLKEMAATVEKFVRRLLSQRNGYVDLVQSLGNQVLNTVDTLRVEAVDVQSEMEVLKAQMLQELSDDSAPGSSLKAKTIF